MTTGSGATDQVHKHQNKILSGSTPSSKRHESDPLSDESEVIELVDVVRKDALPENSAPSAEPFEQERETSFEEDAQIDLDELTKEMKILSETTSESDQNTEEDSLETSDFDFETHEEPYAETSGDFPDEDLEEIMSKLEQEGRTCSPSSPASAGELPGLTEARVEALIREVVEKAVREAMARVAEKVIKEAIDSLKESLKP